MPRPRLGIGLEHILTRTPLTGRPGAPFPDAHPPVAGMVEWLVELILRYEVVVYPVVPQAGRAAAISHWIWIQAKRYYTAAGDPDPRDSADRLVDSIAFTDCRARCDITIEAGSLWYPGDGPLPTLAEIERAATLVLARRAA